MHWRVTHSISLEILVDYIYFIDHVYVLGSCYVHGGISEGDMICTSVLIFPFHCISGGNSVTGAIAGGVAAGAALLFAAPAIAFAWWRRRKPQEFFFDVPG